MPKIPSAQVRQLGRIRGGVRRDDRAGYFPSRSRMRYVTWDPASSRSMTRFRAAWVTHAAVGWAVAPRIRTRRVACSMTARTCRRAPVNVVVSKKSAARMAWAGERRNVAQVSLVRWGAGSIPASWRISRTVEAAILTPRTSSSPWILRSPPGAVLAGQAQHQPADRSDGGWPASLCGSGDRRVPVGDLVAVPAQYGLRADQQPDAAQHVSGQPVQQRGEPRPISRAEPDLLAVQVPFEDRDLVAEREDLGVFGAVAHRQEPEQRERVGHAEVGQSKQRSASSSRSYRRGSRGVGGSTARHRGGSHPGDQSGHGQDG
jgi:hypothetical protein